MQPFRDRFAVIATLAMLFFFNFLARFIWSPLLPRIERDLGISHTGAGALFLFVMAGYCLGVLASGYLSARFDHQKTITLSSLSCGIALMAASLGTSLVFLQSVLVLIGITAGLYLPSGIASLTYGLAPRDFGKAFSIHEISPSLAFIAAPLLAEAMMGWSTWRGVVWPIAAGLIAIGLFYAAKRPTGDFKGAPLTLSNIRRVTSQPALWLMLVVFALAVAANVGVFAMIPLYLQAEKRMGPSWTHFVLSASRTAAMGSPLVAGWLCAQYRPRTVMAAVTLLSGVTTAMIGIAADRWLWISILLQSVFAAAFFPAAFAVLMELVEGELRNLVIALVIPVAVLLGAGAFPPILGVFGDRGMFFRGFVLTGILVVASIFLIFFVRSNEGSIQTRRVA